MRAVVQRVSEASIAIDGKPSGTMQRGIVLLLGVGQSDSEKDIDWLLSKILNLRIFEDSDGKMNQSLIDISGDLMIVSQFTLFGNMKKGNRPSFNHSAPPDIAIPLYDTFVAKAREAAPAIVLTGSFGAHMDVRLTNDGPVTLILDTENKDF